jgi:hypothetical protein
MTSSCLVNYSKLWSEMPSQCTFDKHTKLAPWRRKHLNSCACSHSVFRRLVVFMLKELNLLRSYVGPRPTLWFSCSRRFSWSLTFFNPIFLPPAYSPAFIYFGRERGWWITCNYPTVLKEKNINIKSTTCSIYWLKSVLHEEKRREQENYNVGLRPTLWFSSCNTDFSQKIAQVVPFLFIFFSFKTVG